MWSLRDEEDEGGHSQQAVCVCVCVFEKMWLNGSFRPAQLPGSRQHCHGNRLFLPLLFPARLAYFYLIRQHA